ncbi:GatB/YqeY domain-containing protein [Qipengyuania sp.]|uniref:GatB/YqeY domain-containing protein n=1 Tax=Qipengyuania sp. TaxID=2004515 RepID=UPI003AF983C8
MLREKIQAETVTAMKAKDKDRTAALRLIGAKIKDRDIELRTSDTKPEDDELVTDVLLKMAKQRRESIEMYEDGGRQELADKEKSELAVIEEFLPKQMSEDETRAAIAAIKADLNAEGMKDMGRVMGELKARHGATLDMTKASGLVKEALS